MSGPRPVLTVRGLGVRLAPARAGAPAPVLLHDVDLGVGSGEVLVVVGESGAGKSMTLRTLMGLLPATAQVRGEALLHPGSDTGAPVDLLAIGERRRRRLRGRELTLLPQGPLSHLTAVRTVGSQLREVGRLHARGREATQRLVADALRRSGAGTELLARYPHELSGGQVQRVSNAAALMGSPRLVLADEPTTGLDPDRVEETVRELRRQADLGRAVVVVTHDLDVARAVGDTVVVLYAGRTVEQGPAERVLGRPGHPYTAALLAARPAGGLVPLAGDPPAVVTGEHEGCPFAPRCPLADDRCRTQVPVLRETAPGTGHQVACHHAGKAAAPAPPGAVGARC